MWDERYNTKDFVYGTDPNDFLVQQVEGLRQRQDWPQQGGTCLMLADGEGRNGVYMAQQGLDVTSVDISKVGLDKAEQLAAASNVSITTVLADLGEYDFGTAKWDMIVGIFCHLPTHVREGVLEAIPNALKGGGVVLFEGYTPKQLEYNTGGPANPEWMYSSDIFEKAFHGKLEIERNEELVRRVVEGTFHTGEASVVQLVARKPSAPT